MKFLRLVLILLATATASPAVAATWYVNYTAGNDTLDGLSPAVSGSSGPFRHVGHALGVAATADTIRLAAGTYLPQNAGGFGDITTDSLVVIGEVAGPMGGGTVLNAQLANQGLSIRARHVRLENLHMRAAKVGILIAGNTDSLTLFRCAVRRCDANYNDFAIRIAPTAGTKNIRLEELVVDSVSNGIYFDCPANDTLIVDFIGNTSVANVTYNDFGWSGVGSVPQFEAFKTQLTGYYHLQDVLWETSGSSASGFLFGDLRSTYDWMQIIGNTTGLSMDSATCTNFDSTTWYLHPSMRNVKTLPKLDATDTLFFLNGNHRKGSFPTFLPIDSIYALVTGDTIGQTTLDARIYTTGVDITASGTRLRNLRVFGAEANGLRIDGVSDVEVVNCILEESKVPPIAGSQQLRVANASNVLLDGVSVLNYYDHIPVVHAGSNTITLRNMRLEPTITADEQVGLLLTTDTLDGFAGGSLQNLTLGGNWTYTGPYSAIRFADTNGDSIQINTESNLTLITSTFRRVLRAGQGIIPGWAGLANQLEFGAELYQVYDDIPRASRSYLINNVEAAYFNLQEIAGRGGKATDFLLKALPEGASNRQYFIIDYPADSPRVALSNAAATMGVYAASDTLNWYSPTGTSNPTAEWQLMRPAVLNSNGFVYFDSLSLAHPGDTSVAIKRIRVNQMLNLGRGYLDLRDEHLRLEAGIALSGGSDSSYIIAPRVEQSLFASDTATYALPLASDHYRPIEVKLETPFDSSSKIIAYQSSNIESLQLSETLDTVLSNVQWNVEFTALYAVSDTALATINFHFNDSDAIPSDTGLVMLGGFGGFWRALPTVRDTTDPSVFQVTVGVFGFNTFQLGKRVFVEPETEERAVVFQTILTPNGDGKNDVFSHPILETATDYDFKVFSANGLLVYDRRNSPDRFAGLDNNNNELTAGTYYYVLELTTAQGSKTVKSYLTLRR